MNLRASISASHPATAALEPNRQRERGYTLVALLALMTILAMFAVAAAPNLRQQAQREREKEAIFRGEQVADAIRLYYGYYGSHGRAFPQSLPTSVDQLLEGIPQGTRKVQILRTSAAHDPLSATGEWRLIAPQSQGLLDFERSVAIYAGGLPPIPRDRVMQQLQVASVPPIGNILNTSSTDTAPGGEDNSGSSSGPFVGVGSRSRRNSVINYYGIDRHDQWIFTPLFR